MSRGILGMTRALAAALVLVCVGGAELAAQNQGIVRFTGPDQPITRVGTRGANFLHLGVGARSMAMSGAGALAAEGVTTMYWNPAGAAEVEQFAFGVSYTELYPGSGIEHYFVGGLLPALGGVIGISANVLSSGDIPRVVETTPSGDNVQLGMTFEWTAGAYGAYYARRITDRLSMGAGLKAVTEGMEGARANWVSADVGTRFRTGLYGTSLAITVANMGGSAAMKGPLVTAWQRRGYEIWDTRRDISVELNTTKLDLPTYVRFGFAMDLAGLPESVLSADPRHSLKTFIDLYDAVDTDMQPTIAFEYGFNDLFFVRAGKQWFNEVFAEHSFDSGLSGGFGLRLPVLGRHVAFDYAYAAMGEALKSKQVLSFELGW
jgi:hypothetical protein